MINDPLSRRALSGIEILATGMFIHTTPQKVHALPEDMPLLVLQGTDDNVCSPTSVKQIITNKTGFDKQLIYLRNCGHVLLGTSYIKPRVSELLLTWLERHNQSTTAGTPGNAVPVALTERLVSLE